MTARDLTIYYSAQWRKAYGKSYTIAWSKHVPMFKRLLGFHEPEYIRQLVDTYIHNFSDSFSVRIGKPIEDFIRQVPALVALQNTAVKGEATKEAAASDFDRLVEARKKLSDG